MTKTVYYTYLGTNGVIESPVHLEDIFYTRKLRLVADQGKQLTKDGKTFYSVIMIPENELAEWKEVYGQF